MPIKKSSLEQKWYYRIAKVFFLILPLLVVFFIFLSGKRNLSDIFQKNITDILQKNIVYIIYVVIGLVFYYLILKWIWRGFLYLIFGGLEDDTKKNDSETAQPVNSSAQQAVPFIILAVILAIAVLFQMRYIKLPKINLNPEQPNHVYGASCTTSDGKKGLYGTNGTCYACSNNGTAVTNPINNNCSSGIAGVYCCGSNNDGCISTGCGSMWYCSGRYYIGSQEINVPGLCFPTHPRNVYSSWTGTCRQCP